MYLEGERFELEKMESVVAEMIITVNQKGFVDENDVKSLLNFSQSETSKNHRKSDFVIF